MATIEIRRRFFDEPPVTKIRMRVPFSPEAWSEAAKTLYERRFDLAHSLLVNGYTAPWTLAVKSIFAVLITDDGNEWGIDDILEVDFFTLTQQPNDYIPPKTIDEALVAFSEFFD